MVENIYEKIKNENIHSETIEKAISDVRKETLEDSLSEYCFVCGESFNYDDTISVGGSIAESDGSLKQISYNCTDHRRDIEELSKNILFGIAIWIDITVDCSDKSKINEITVKDYDYFSANPTE